MEAPIEPVAPPAVPAMDGASPYRSAESPSEPKPSPERGHMPHTTPTQYETDPEPKPVQGEHGTCARCDAPITWKTSHMWGDRWTHDGIEEAAEEHDAELGGPA